jgi:hypothetical protein
VREIGNVLIAICSSASLNSAGTDELEPIPEFDPSIPIVEVAPPIPPKGLSAAERSLWDAEHCENAAAGLMELRMAADLTIREKNAAKACSLLDKMVALCSKISAKDRSAIIQRRVGLCFQKIALKYARLGENTKALSTLHEGMKIGEQLGDASYSVSMEINFAGALINAKDREQATFLLEEIKSRTDFSSSDTQTLKSYWLVARRLEVSN